MKNIEQLWKYLLNPVPERESSNFITKLTRFLFVFGINIVVVAAVIGIQYGFKTLGLIDVDILPDVDNKNVYILLTFLICMIFIVPIIEELAFRLHLLPEKLNIKISAAVFIIYACMQLVYMAKSTFTFNAVCYLVAAVLVGCIIFPKRIDDSIKELWKTKFRSVFYITALVFGGVHMINHRLSVANLIFAPLIVAPQIILGLNVGYLRVKSGFRWGLLLHMLHNLVFVGGVFYVMNPGSLNFDKNEFVIDYPPVSTPAKDYSLTIGEGKGSVLNVYKITPDEISFENAKMKYVFTQLANANHAKVFFQDSTIENKIINLRFVNKSKDKSKLRNDRHFIIAELFKKYNLKAKLYIVPEGKWLLTQKTDSGHLLTKASVPVSNDDNKNVIIMKDVTVKQLVDKIDTCYSLNCVALIQDGKKYNFRIPKNDVVALQKILLEKYGFEFHKMKARSDCFYVSSKNE